MEVLQMKILEFGDTSKRKIILIHGFQCPWQVWNKYIEYYKNDFHVIVPIMSGHNPEEKEDLFHFLQRQRSLRIILFHATEKICMPFMVCQWVVF